MNLNIRKYRESMGITQQELAKEIGKSFRTIQSWERGESYPNAEYLWKLCEYFDTDPNTFLGWYDEHPRHEETPLSSDEQELISLHRQSTPEWRHNLMQNARASALASKDAAERDTSDVRKEA